MSEKTPPCKPPQANVHPSIAEEEPTQHTLSPQPSPSASTSLQSTDRAELISRARAFLTAPEIRSQELDAKQAFLSEKGLTNSEIDLLLRELPPPVPPRTYPPPVPSALPNLLIGIARVFSWLTGSSAIVLFIYYRYLLPRISQSYQARLALRNHHLSLLARLKHSAEELKAEQAVSYQALPRPEEHCEIEPFAGFETLDDVIAHAQLLRSTSPSSTQPSTEAQAGEKEENIPGLTILRCGLTELLRGKLGDGTDGGNEDQIGVSTEELFAHLERRLPWLSGENERGTERQSELWKLLTTCPLFTSSPPPQPRSDASSYPSESAASSAHPSRLLWKYTPASPPPVPPLLSSLTKLRAALPRTPEPDTLAASTLQSAPPFMARQRTLQVLSEFTGYITAQIYSLPLAPSLPSTIRSGPGDSVQEDEIRREIRALKGLVLNRRSFLSPNTGVGAAGVVGGSAGRPSSEPALETRLP